MANSSTKQSKYGLISGPRYGSNQELKASEVFSRVGGAFVQMEAATGTVDVAAAADTVIFGWAEVGFGNENSVSGNDYTVASGDTAYVITAKDAVFRIPADATPAKTDIGKACDIVLSGNIQQADIGTSSTDVLVIADVDEYDIANNTVQVRINKFQATT
jgi:hypothetical protein